ncbi:hypothetical protein ACWDR0_10530 [Streptomyces sp. NPDC003691]
MTTDFIGEIHTLLTQHTEMADRHRAALARFMTPDGTVDETQYAAYDETRTDNAIEASDFLDDLAARLEALTGPPVPGQAFTLTYAASGHADGEAPFRFIVNGSDLDDARRALATLPFWHDWHEGQKNPSDIGTSGAPDVLFLAEQSHPGIPDNNIHDMRRDQAAALAPTPSTSAGPWPSLSVVST